MRPCTSCTRPCPCTYTTLISAPELQALTASGAPLMVFDCSFDLTAPAAGEQQYLPTRTSPAPSTPTSTTTSSAATARPAPPAPSLRTEADTPASGGRHPLPSRERFAIWLSSVGFSNDMQAVVYDRNGANYCGRLWWMLQWLGHDAVAVLDGGLQAWQAAGGAVASGAEPAHFQSNFFAWRAPCAAGHRGDVLQGLGQPGQTVIDARAARATAGEVEPLDPVAGHIPGALNRPFTDNFGPDGRFKSPGAVAHRVSGLAGWARPCHRGAPLRQRRHRQCPTSWPWNWPAWEDQALYAGSWSEWCSDPARPVERG